MPSRAQCHSCFHLTRTFHDLVLPETTRQEDQRSKKGAARKAAQLITHHRPLTTALKLPAPSPAACNANTAAPQSESRSNTLDTFSSWDQAALLRDSCAPPAHSPASPQKSRSPRQPAENSPGQSEILRKETASRRS